MTEEHKLDIGDVMNAEARDPASCFASFVCEVASRAGIDVAEAPRVVNTTARLLGARLSKQDADTIAAQLPVPIGDRLRAASSDNETAKPLRIEARGLKMSERELRASCQVFAEVLDEQTRALLRMHPNVDLFMPTEVIDSM